MSLANQLSPRALAARFLNGASERSKIMDRRAALFRETMWERCQRVTLGTAWALRPKRIRKLLPLAQVWLADLIAPQKELPHPETGRSHEFAGMVHDLAPTTLIAAYMRGLFPKTHFGPLKWLSPPERCVLFFDEYHISKRVRSLMRQDKYRVTFDRDFEGVMKACAGPRPGRWQLTWITPRIMRAYAELYDAGYVHCFEVWNRDDELVGGGYGVVLGSVFVIESQFSRESNTSKIGFSVLNWHLAKWGFVLSDNKEATPTISQMGFRMIPRAEYLHRLAAALQRPGKTGTWAVEDSPRLVANWRPANDRAARGDA